MYELVVYRRVDLLPLPVKFFDVFGRDIFDVDIRSACLHAYHLCAASALYLSAPNTAPFVKSFGSRKIIFSCTGNFSHAGLCRGESYIAYLTRAAARGRETEAVGSFSGDGMNNRAQAGRAGKGVRSDCLVTIERNGTSTNTVTMRSKVDVLYGRSNRELVDAVLAFYSLGGVDVDVDDSGALPYTLAARLECAVRRLVPEETRAYPVPEAEGCVYPTAADRRRRSRLYLPGNDPKLAVNAGIHGPDGIILDLEDSVAPAEKDAARILVRNTLVSVDFGGAERMVRINQLPLGLEDLDAIIPQRPNLILIPKCESAQDVRAVAERIATLHEGRGHDIHLMPIIESAAGTLRALDIAMADPAVVALAIGLEDYTADIGAERTLEGTESFWMRGMVLNAAKAAGVQAIDTVFSDVNDMDALLASCREAKSLGFDGKGCIHPRQIPVVHRGFAPREAEIDRAKRIVLAFDEAQAKGLGVVSLGSKMIDPPVVKRALRVIDDAVGSGLLGEDWKEAEHE
jgi:citrate lyase subunit beta/citryl-CoA lyase